MTGAGYVTIYANAVAIMLMLGVNTLAARLKVKDKLEKKIFLSLLGVMVVMSVFYILMALRDERILPCNKAGAMAIETLLELTINIFAIQWFVYVIYRMYHSISHFKRNNVRIFIPFLIMMLLDIVNAFTGFLFYFDDDLLLVEQPLYILTDLIRTGYFVASLIALAMHRKHDDRLRFFSLRAFFIPMMFFVLLYYFTPYATAALGMAIGLTLIYAQIVNEQCYQDTTTGFYNGMYLDYLKKRMEENDYTLESAMSFRIPEKELVDSAHLISEQFPDECDTVRIKKDTILTLTPVNDRGPLFMLSEDVQMVLAEANVEAIVKYDLRKKNESSVEFLDRFLKKVK